MDIFHTTGHQRPVAGRRYTIISLGLTLIFGVVRVVNFAHGEFLMVGMYLVYLIAAQFGVHPYLGLAPVAVILALARSLTQKGIIQPLLNADQHIQIFATVGVSTILLNPGPGAVRRQRAARAGAAGHQRHRRGHTRW